MSKKTIFTGAGVALITPMNTDGSVNYDRYRSLVEWHIQHGTDAIIAVGTTGEAPTLEDDEHIECLRVAAEQARHRIPVIGGTGSNNTAHCIDMSKKAAAAGVDALLMVTPYYNKTSQRGLLEHYKAAAAATDLPIILYNVPSRTGVNIKPETVIELSKISNIVALKQASGNFSDTVKIAAGCDIDLYSGNDDQITAMLSLGGKGVISVLSNVIPQETHDICQKWFDGDAAGSLALQKKYLELANALFMDVNPIPVKDAMNLLGMDAGPCRLPLLSMGAAEKKLLGNVLKRCQLL